MVQMHPGSKQLPSSTCYHQQEPGAMSLSFQGQNARSVGNSQVPLQRLRHQRPFSSGTAQAKECHSQCPDRHASSSGVFQSGNTPPLRLRMSTHRRSAVNALAICQASAEKQTIAVTGAKFCTKLFIHILKLFAAQNLRWYQPHTHLSKTSTSGPGWSTLHD